MPVRRLPETVHTLYAELLDRVVVAEAEAVARGLPPPGSFVAKRVKGNTYWYLQRSIAGRREQRYLVRSSEEPVVLRRLGVAARPLAFLDYLLEETLQAVLLHGAGVLVNVPDPARFAFHKVWLDDRRPAALHARARKDLDQAEALLEVLLDDRPRDLRRAWAAVRRKRRGQVERALERLRPELREGVLRAAFTA